MGYITETIQTGKEAIKKVKERTYNIILTDIRLPDTDGIQLITPLKELQLDIVVMMITSYASQETAMAALNKEASVYIAESFDMQEVLTIIRKTFEKQRLVREKKLLHRQLQQLFRIGI